MRHWFFFLLAITLPALAQTDADTSGEDNSIDISDKNLKRLYRQQDFYINQLKKKYFPPKITDRYSVKLQEAEGEIKTVRSKRLEAVRNNQSQYDKEKFNFQFRDMDVDVSRLESPIYYANEISSVVFNLGVSLLDFKKYSAPVVVSAERVFTERFSGGGFFGYFVEKFRDYKNFEEENPYFSSNAENYKYNDYMAGIRGSFHLLKPMSKYLSYRKFDVYLSGLAGMNFTSDTRPFIDNEKYIKDGFEDSRKRGPVYGGFAGLRFMYDDLLGFYVEAGYANTAFANAGLTLRMLKKHESGFGQDVIVFKVKVLSTSKPLSLTDPKLRGLTGVELYSVNNSFIYTTGNEQTLIGAEAVKASMIKHGFKKPEIVAFKNDELIKTKKAAKILKKREKAGEKEVLPGSE